MKAEEYLGLPWTWKLEESREDDCWLVTVAEMPDFFAAGDSEAEAYANAREAFVSHIRSYLATHSPIPTPAAKFVDAPRRAASAATASTATCTFAFV